MLKDTYRFKMDYTDWAQIRAQINAIEQNSALLITPHKRSNAKRVALMVVCALKEMNIRLGRKLERPTAVIAFTIKQSEILAFLIAYQSGWLPGNLASMKIIETIDRIS
jgi:hypothetical protein